MKEVKRILTFFTTEDIPCYKSRSVQKTQLRLKGFSVFVDENIM